MMVIVDRGKADIELFSYLYLKHLIAIMMFYEYYFSIMHIKSYEICIKSCICLSSSNFHKLKSS